MVEISQIAGAFPLASAYVRNYAKRHAEAAYDYDFVIRPFHASVPLERIVGSLVADAGDVYTFSCYCWNMKQMRRVLSALQAARPQASFLLGGPQVLTCADRYVEPHQTNTFVCNGEGEITTQSFLDAHSCEQPDYSTVPGLSFFRERQLVTTAAAPQVDLDSIPSPFLSSPFDESTVFLHYLWETNRGCPFQCTFCLWGQLQDTIAKFDLERLKEEITWMAKHQYLSLHICDANWGMLERDLELSEHIARCKRDYGVPFMIAASHIKNQPERVIKIAETFTREGIQCTTTAALQSINDKTLVTIKRKNTTEGMFDRFQHSLAERGFGSLVEIIWPLPDESLPSLKASFGKLSRVHIASVLCYPLMLLNNTEMKARREEHGFTTYWDPSDVKEIEWVLSTKDVSKEECDEGFWFYLAFHLLYNTRALYYTMHYLHQRQGLSYEALYESFAETLKASDSPLGKLVRGIVVDRNPSLDGATYGILLEHVLQSQREGYSRFLAEHCARQPWWSEPEVRLVFQLDLLARPFPFKGQEPPRPPGDSVDQLFVRQRERGFVVALPPSLFSWLRNNLEVGRLPETASGNVLIDHERNQLPHMPHKALDQQAYQLLSLLYNVRSICPRIVACDAAGRPIAADVAPSALAAVS